MPWFWMALSAAVLWGLGYAINQVTLKYFSGLELLFFEAITIFTTCTIYFIYTGGLSSFINKLSNPKHLSLIISSSLIYIVASLFIFKSISSSNASLAAIIESCYPIFTVLFAFVILGELQLNLASAVGFILIISGIIIIKFYGK